ncbi:MAG: hypothetical protein ABI068_04125, partial [Ktedonobacterales bacterium]
MSWLRAMSCAPVRQGMRDILFLGGGGIVRAIISPTTSITSNTSTTTQAANNRASLGAARAGTHWGWASATERDGSQPTGNAPSGPRPPTVLRPFKAESLPIGTRASAAGGPYSEIVEITKHNQNAISGAVEQRSMPQDIHCLRAPRETLQHMERMASMLGRSESEVWAEAARDWLARRDNAIALLDADSSVGLSRLRSRDDRDDEPPPAAPAALPLPLRPV